MNLRESKPLIVETDGAVIKGLKIENHRGFAIVIKASNVTVQECDLSGSVGICGPVKHTVIQNNYIHDIRPNRESVYNKQFAGVTTTEGPNYGNPIEWELGAEHITVRGNYFSNTPSGIYLVGAKGNLIIDGNFSFNHRGPFPRGQLCQLLFCDATPETQIRIERNFGYVDFDTPEQRDQDVDHCGAEDHINCHKCYGCEQSPIVIRDNFLYGGSSSNSNSGIMAGDGGGSYYLIENNRVYYTENCGIGICGGKGTVIRGNTVFQDRCLTLPDRRDGRGIQIECYGDKFEGPLLVANNKVCFRTAKGDASLFCASDKAVFSCNEFYSSAEEFGDPEPLPPFEPRGAQPGLMRPWVIEPEYLIV